MPRFYRFDGSTGMDLRPAAVLETDAARIDELRRRRDSMAVATRIRMVDQPPEGLLPLSLFDRTPLPDRTALHPRTMETVAPDIAGLYVDYMTRIAMGAPKRVAFRIPLLGARLVGQGEYAESLLSRMVDFAFPSARAACLLLDFDIGGWDCIPSTLNTSRSGGWVSSTPAGTRCGCWTWTGLRRSSSIGLTVSRSDIRPDGNSFSMRAPDGTLSFG